MLSAVLNIPASGLELRSRILDTGFYSHKAIAHLSLTEISYVSDAQGKIVVLLTFDRAGQDHRVFVNVSSDIAVAEHWFGIETLLNLLLHFWSR